MAELSVIRISQYVGVIVSFSHAKQAEVQVGVVSICSTVGHVQGGGGEVVVSAVDGEGEGVVGGVARYLN